MASLGRYAAAAPGPGGNFNRKKTAIKNMSAKRAMTGMMSLSGPYRSARIEVTVRSSVSKCRLREAEHSVGSSLSTDKTIKLFRHAMPSKSHIAKVTELSEEGGENDSEAQEEDSDVVLLLSATDSATFFWVSWEVLERTFQGSAAAEGPEDPAEEGPLYCEGRGGRSMGSRTRDKSCRQWAKSPLTFSCRFSI